MDDLESWLNGKEDEHLEFKQAKNNFDSKLLARYCAALANEGGGKMILGVTDKRPRQIVGSSAFDPLERTKAGLVERLRIRVDAEEILHPDGRVVIFHVPSRPLGAPVQLDGAYWMRAGEDLVAMTPDRLKTIFDEAGPDFSAQTCPDATLADLDADAIERFRAMWLRKSARRNLEQLDVRQLLSDAELVVDGGITYAALILFGTRAALGRHLAQAEVIFEYRSTEASIAYQQREEFRQGFFLFQDALWAVVNLRNDIQQFRSGLFRYDIPTFNEDVIREAVLNAVTHRDYRLGGSVFIRQFPRQLEIASPGGFPPGINPSNVVWRQSPRNRRLAEACARCGLVERSGQGMNMMFEQCIRESKPQPDFSGSDDYQVSVTLRGEVQDANFLRFLESLGEERLAQFSTQDLLILDLVHREQPVPDEWRQRLKSLVELGAVERKGAGRFMLSRHYYSFVGQKGVYTRKRGLDRETNKALLLKHLEGNRNDGSRLGELVQVLPSLSRSQVQHLLRDLQHEGRAHIVGVTSAARWFPGALRDGP